MILGLDVSAHQGAVNFAAAKAAGRDFVVMKATEGVGWSDPTFATNRAAAHAAGLIVGIYHFASAGVPTNEAAYFTGVVGNLQPGEFLVLDWETSFTGDHVAWCTAWLEAVRAKTGVAPLIYMNQSTVAGHNWSALAQTYGLWLARYDNAPSVVDTVPYWGSPAMKQYSDAGSVLGVSGGVDVDVFYGSVQQLLAYGKGGTPTPTPPEDVVTPQDIAAISDAVANRMVGPDGAAWQEWDAAANNAKAALAAANAVGTKVDALAAKVGQVTAPAVDPVAFANALAGNQAAMQVFAAALAPVLAKQLGTNLANG